MRGKRRSASITGAIFMKFGRAPTTWTTVDIPRILANRRVVAAGLADDRDEPRRLRRHREAPLDPAPGAPAQVVAELRIAGERVERAAPLLGAPAQDRALAAQDLLVRLGPRRHRRHR